jgi:hypothetical protein
VRTGETVKATLSAARAHPAHQPLEQRAQQAHRQRLPGAPRKLSSSSINSIAALCEATGADVREVARAIGADSRIGAKFLQAGPGFGGSCFQTDILNLVVLCRHDGLHEVAATWEQVVALNTWQQQRIARLVVNRLFGTVTGKRIAVLGFAFKAHTNDTRESPAIRICRDLLKEGAVLAIVDPKVSERQIAADLGLAPGNDEGSWHLVADANQAASGADALLLTEWPQFAALDWAELAPLHGRRACACGWWGMGRGRKAVVGAGARPQAVAGLGGWPAAGHVTCGVPKPDSKESLRAYLKPPRPASQPSRSGTGKTADAASWYWRTMA